ncbi:MAG: type II secretion system F family protein [Candidatus Micrarchaeota archaeon]
MGNEFLRSAVSAFPPLPLSGAALRFAERIGMEPGRYASFSLFLSLFLSALISLLFLPEILLASAAFFLSFALIFFILLRIPRILFMQRVSQMEAELPFSLRMLGMLLELNIPFTESLSILSKGNTPLSEEFRAMEKEVKRGAGIPASLSHLAETLQSLPIKRALLGVSSTYEKGRAGAELIRASGDLLSLQKHAMKDAASKQALLSLVFMAVAVVLPSFLILFSTLGGFSPLPALTPGTAPVLLLLALPALSALVLMVSASLFPPSFFSARIRLPALAPMFAALLLFALLQFSSLPRLPIFALLLAAGAAYTWPLYAQERKRERLEQSLPDAALALSSQPPGRGLEPLLSSMARYSVPPLRDEFLTSLKQAKANVRQDAVLDDLWRRNRSPLLKRFSLFLNHALGAGHDISRYLPLIAEDILSALEMRRERESLLSMQKYTLISGAFLIPFIIGSTLSLSAEIASLGGSAPPELGGTAISYLAIYSFLSAAFVSYAEGRSSSFVAYFALLSLASMALFYTFSGIALW